MRKFNKAVKWPVISQGAGGRQRRWGNLARKAKEVQGF